MDDDKIYKLNGDVQAMKSEMRIGFHSLDGKVEEVKTLFKDHMASYTADKDKMDTRQTAITARLNKIELRVGMVVGALVFALQALGRWIVEHIGKLVT